MTRVIIIEDSADDYEACVLALQQDAASSLDLAYFQTGDEAISWLEGRQKDDGQGDTLPSLVLLDLNLAGSTRSGHDVLRSLKTCPIHKRVPVVILSSSDDHSDIANSYEDGANSYIVKPRHISEFISRIKKIRDYWLTLNHLTER